MSNLCLLKYRTGGTGEGGVAPIWLFFLFVAFNITFNLLMLYIFREGSSVLFVISNTVVLPTVDILLMWRFLSGPAYAKFSLFDGFSLFALVVGITTYQSEREIPGHGPRINLIKTIMNRTKAFLACRSFNVGTDAVKESLLEDNAVGAMDDKKLSIQSLKAYMWPHRR